MYIKQIIIQGFKSYKDQTVVDPFSPKHNVIVGRNGSGKSNFFAAIRFVLGDQYHGMSREERQALLHEGTGSAVMNAYVEIIFDNSDGRFVTGPSEVTLRRSIGLKKDEYSLNRKNITKNEVVRLLESAGFSPSNPYYIVPQGRITHVTNMKDGERLNMLKEIAGTSTYEDRRAESVKVMDESINQRAKVDETLAQISARLSELEEEKNELKDYQKADRERRCLEYTIYRLEQDAFEGALRKVEEDRMEGLGQTDDSADQLKTAEAQFETLDAEIAELQQTARLLTEEQAQIEQDRNDVAKEKATLEFEVQSQLDEQAAMQQSQQQYAAELKDVQQKIKQRETELTKLNPDFEAAGKQSRALQQQIQEADSTRQRLMSKQGRSARYRNKRERDDDLRREMADAKTQLDTRQSIAKQHVSDTAELDKQIAQLEANVASMRERLENRGDEQQDFETNKQKLKDEEDKLVDRRKEIWREEAKLDSLLINARQEMEKAEQFLSRMMDQNTSRGLTSMRRIIKQHGIEGVYGTVGELVSFRNDTFRVPVEITAGTSLFHVVVDTDATATRIVDILQKERGGRVTFMPLNRLRSRPINLPSTNDAVPLINKLTYEPEFETAIQQVFGKTVVCPNLQAASHNARAHGVNAITLDGDRSNKKGALTGGYHDTRHSRLEGLVRAKTAREAHEELVERRSSLQHERETLDQQITKAHSEVQKIRHQQAQVDNGYGPLRQEIQRREQEVYKKQDERATKQRAMDTVEALLAQLQQQISGFEAELAGPFTKALTDEEERLLKTISDPSVRQQYNQVSKRFSDLEAHKQQLEQEIRDSLRPRLDQLRTQEHEFGDTVGERRVQDAQLARASKKLKEWNAKLDKQVQATEQTKQKLDSVTRARDQAQQHVEEIARSMGNVQKMLAKSAQKKRTLQTRLDEVAASIRALGVLPDAAFSSPYSTMESRTATARLSKAQEALKKFTHVNQKAFEQFAESQKKREALESRRAELNKSDSSIRALINYLDQQKDEAIERTFKQVSREFARIFEKLVPAGKGRLIIQRRADRVARNQDEEDSGDEHSSVENYTAVGISVSFNSKHDEQQRIQQLSGGQKSLCALTLIFAIQASDPAPFYLFDEIDANLDAQYRTAVADLIKDSAGTGQFICTTFRSEMLRVADKCYGVNQSHKASSIAPVSIEDALDFVEGQVAAH